MSHKDVIGRNMGFDTDLPANPDLARVWKYTTDSVKFDPGSCQYGDLSQKRLLTISDRRTWGLEEFPL